MTPRLTVVQTEHVRSGWDVRAWRVGLVGGNVSGLCLAISFVVSVTDHSMDVAGILAILSVFVSFIVLPGILSGIARRLWLLWAYLPIGLLFVWLFATAAAVVALHVHGHGSSSPTPSGTVLRVLFIALALPLSTSVPVSLTRLIVARSRARQAARLAFEQAQFTIERVGVWPPPPNAVATDADARDENSYQ